MFNYYYLTRIDASSATEGPYKPPASSYALDTAGYLSDGAAGDTSTGYSASVNNTNVNAYPSVFAAAYVDFGALVHVTRYDFTIIAQPAYSAFQYQSYSGTTGLYDSFQAGGGSSAPTGYKRVAFNLNAMMRYFTVTVYGSQNGPVNQTIGISDMHFTISTPRRRSSSCFLG